MRRQYGMQVEGNEKSTTRPGKRPQNQDTISQLVHNEDFHGIRAIANNSIAGYHDVFYEDRQRHSSEVILIPASPPRLIRILFSPSSHPLPFLCRPSDVGISLPRNTKPPRHEIRTIPLLRLMFLLIEKTRHNLILRHLSPLIALFLFL
jgi:hypothetical protein